MKCKKLKGVIENERSSMDALIDNHMKANLRKKLTRNKTISTGGICNMLSQQSNKKVTASFKNVKRPPISKLTEANMPKYEMKDHSPAFVI